MGFFLSSNKYLSYFEGAPTCRCPKGFTGPYCNLQTCKDYCLNGGNCSVNMGNQPTCSCPPAYQGDQCQYSKWQHFHTILTECLPLVQNAAACFFLTGTRSHDHITPVLADLHWPSVCFCVYFKIPLRTFKLLQGLSPSYLLACLHFYNPNRAPRSLNQMLLVQPTTKLECCRGDQGFFCDVPQTSRVLRFVLKNLFCHFESSLKTHFLTLALNSSSV